MNRQSKANVRKLMTWLRQNEAVLLTGLSGKSLETDSEILAVVLKEAVARIGRGEPLPTNLTTWLESIASQHFIKH